MDELDDFYRASTAFYVEAYYCKEDPDRPTLNLFARKDRLEFVTDQLLSAVMAKSKWRPQPTVQG